jgi:hypothetical protein
MVPRNARKEGRKEKVSRKEGRKEGRKKCQGRKEGRKDLGMDSCTTSVVAHFAAACDSYAPTKEEEGRKGRKEGRKRKGGGKGRKVINDGRPGGKGRKDGSE